LKSEKLAEVQYIIYEGYNKFVQAKAQELGYEDEFYRLELEIGSARTLARKLEEGFAAAHLAAASFKELKLTTPSSEYHIGKALILLAKVVRLQNDYYVATRNLVRFKIKKIGGFDKYKARLALELEPKNEEFFGERQDDFSNPFKFKKFRSSDDDWDFMRQDDEPPHPFQRRTKAKKEQRQSSLSHSDEEVLEPEKPQPGELEENYVKKLAASLEKTKAELWKQLGKVAIATGLSLRIESFFELYSVEIGSTAKEIIDFISNHGAALARADKFPAISISESESDIGEDDEVVVEVSVELPIVSEKAPTVSKIAVKEDSESGASVIGTDLLSALCFGLAALTIIF
jgi:hypothetical protein